MISPHELINLLNNKLPYDLCSKIVYQYNIVQTPSANCIKQLVNIINICRKDIQIKQHYV